MHFLKKKQKKKQPITSRHRRKEPQTISSQPLCQIEISPVVRQFSVDVAPQLLSLASSSLCREKERERETDIKSGLRESSVETQSGCGGETASAASRRETL